ncbi:MAG: YitT family protein [Clostridia bacterium]|nr:YitT family protein [Clostridia bacterium]
MTIDKAKKKVILNECKGYVLMLIGCFSYAISTVVFLAPNSIVAGGVTGLSTLIYLLTNGRALIGVVSIAINIPIFILGLKYTGWKFILRSLLTVTMLGVITDILETTLVLDSFNVDPVLASLYGGVCQGIGIGLFVKYEFSSGGTELFGRLISKWFKIGNIPV